MRDRGIFPNLLAITAITLGISACDSGPKPAATPRLIPTATAEATKTPEKQPLTDVEFVHNLLEKYLNLDADPRLKELKDSYTLRSKLSKYTLNPDLLVDRKYTSAPLGGSNPTQNAGNLDTSYGIPSVGLYISVETRAGKIDRTYIGFYMDGDGKIVSSEDPRLNQNEPVPSADELKKELLSGTKNAAKFFTQSTGSWSIDQANDPSKEGIKLGIMNATTNSSDGSTVKYSVAGTGEKPLSVSALITAK